MQIVGLLQPEELHAAGDTWLYEHVKQTLKIFAFVFTANYANMIGSYSDIYQFYHLKEKCEVESLTLFNITI